MTSRTRTLLHHLRRGPALWAVSACAGLIIGSITALVLPPQMHDGVPVIELWMTAPFVLLLAAIALMPFISLRFWHHHYPDCAFFLGGLVVGYYLTGFPMRPSPDAALTYGQDKLLHALDEYYRFIALVGGLYVISGGILIDLRGRGTAWLNTLVLGFGAVIANVVGTTGASMLLIRPFMRINRGRLRPIHIIFFIFVVSNCGGALTPIGDPPLYLGYLNGVPFFWTLTHLWQDWLFTVGALLALFYVLDRRLGPARTEGGPPLVHEIEAERLIEEELRRSPGVSVSGTTSLVALALVVGAVFLDPLLEQWIDTHHLPLGATVQIAVAAAAWALAPRHILRENDFSFAPVREVALLFLGIFVTMTPALSYLAAHGPGLGLSKPTAFYFGTGVLSAMLDNAPTYLNFLQIAVAAVVGEEMSQAAVRAFLASPLGPIDLVAISTAAVFFGAMTYIGNGPNFMVKAIAESAGVPMPTFLGYTARALVMLGPVLILHWVLFIR